MNHKTISLTDHDDTYVHVTIHHLDFCLPVYPIQDVLITPTLTHVPLSKHYICGLMNLRGRIVTAIDMGIHLGLDATYSKEAKNMSVIVEEQGELYGLIFSTVGEVLKIPAKHIDTNPSAVETKWRDYTKGIYLYDNRLTVVLNLFDLVLTL